MRGDAWATGIRREERAKSAWSVRGHTSRAECIESKSEKKKSVAVVTVVGGRAVGRLAGQRRMEKRRRREKRRAATPGAILLEFK